MNNLNNPIITTSTLITHDILDRILEEISKYEIELDEDPTQPHLKQAYLQQIVAQCRRYQNRVHYYLTTVKRYESSLRRNIKQNELDFDLKINERLADDSIVRQGPSIEDRKARAIMMLKTEHDILAELKVALLDAEEYYKIIKSKYDQLRQTAADIRLQRALVRDDIMERIGGGSGYTKPQANQDGTIEGGLPPVVKTKAIEPKDLFDPIKRPDDMPEPIDAKHAQLMAEFLNKHPEKSSSVECVIDHSTDKSSSNLLDKSNFLDENKKSFYDSFLD
jgi:hypothetical protein